MPIPKTTHVPQPVEKLEIKQFAMKIAEYAILLGDKLNPATLSFGRLLTEADVRRKRVRRDKYQKQFEELRALIDALTKPVADAAMPSVHDSRREKKKSAKLPERGGLGDGPAKPHTVLVGNPLGTSEPITEPAAVELPQRKKETHMTGDVDRERLNMARDAAHCYHRLRRHAPADKRPYYKVPTGQRINERFFLNLEEQLPAVSQSLAQLCDEYAPLVERRDAYELDRLLVHASEAELSEEERQFVTRLAGVNDQKLRIREICDQKLSCVESLMDKFTVVANKKATADLLAKAAASVKPKTTIRSGATKARPAAEAEPPAADSSKDRSETAAASATQEEVATESPAETPPGEPAAKVAAESELREEVVRLKEELAEANKARAAAAVTIDQQKGLLGSEKEGRAKAEKHHACFVEDCAMLGLEAETWAAEVLKIKKTNEQLVEEIKSIGAEPGKLQEFVTKLRERTAEPEKISTNGEKPVDKPKAAVVKLSEVQQLQFELNGNHEVPESREQLSSFSSDEIEEYLLKLQEKLKAKLAAAPASQPARSGASEQASVSDLPALKSLEQMNENLRRDNRVVAGAAAVLLVVAIVLGIIWWNAMGAPSEAQSREESDQQVEEPEQQAEETPFVPFKAKPLPSLN